MTKEAGAFEKYGLRGEMLYIAAGSVAVQAMMGGEVEAVAGATNKRPRPELRREKPSGPFPADPFLPR